MPRAAEKIAPTMKISIKTLLIGGFIGLQVIPTSIILASSYLTSQQVLLRHARDIMENIATFSIRDAQGYLAPAKLMGVESNGMLLAAHDEDGLALVSFDKEVKAGVRIK